MGDFRVNGQVPVKLSMGSQALGRLYYNGQWLWETPPPPPPPVTPAFIAGQSSANLAYTAVDKVCPAPSNLAEGDLILAVCSCDYGDSANFAVPTGFTWITEEDRGLNLPKMIFGYKVATATEPTSYTWYLPEGADARVDMFAVRSAETTVKPVVTTAVTAASATTHAAPAVSPFTRDGLVFAAASLSGSDVGMTFDWTAPAGLTERTDSTTNGYQTQTVAVESVTTADPVPARDFTLATTSAAMPAITASIAVASLNSSKTSSGPLASVPANGTGGDTGLYGDYQNVEYTATFTDGTTATSFYHVYAAHLDGTQPRGIAFMLHGDGAYEPDNPDVFTVPEYVKQARRHGMILVVPKSPDRDGVVTWWEDYVSQSWLGWLYWAFREMYNVDINRVWWVGFSGGAQVTSYNMVADWHTDYGGGGALMLGGGSMEGGSISGTVDPTFKSQFAMRWVCGDSDEGVNDDGTIAGDGFDALAAANSGYDFYTKEGFRTSIVLLPGQDHLESEDKGPAEWGKFLDEMYGSP